jgi:hypothetical protein
MAGNGIGTPMDVLAAVRYYDLSSDQSPNGAALYGRCHQIGRGTPVDFHLQENIFRKQQIQAIQLVEICEHTVREQSS